MGTKSKILFKAELLIKIIILQSLEQQYVQLCAINEQNTKSAMLEARNMYVTSMRLQMDNAGISSNKLEAVNLRALNEANELFYKHRNRETQQGDDFYVQKLVQVCHLVNTEPIRLLLLTLNIA